MTSFIIKTDSGANISSTSIFDLPNIIVTTGEVGSGKVNSIAEALELITDATAETPRTIFILSGEYLEPTLVMKPYISLIGVSRSTVVIKPQNPNQTLIVGSPHVLIRELSLEGTINPNNPAILYNGGNISQRSGEEFRLSRIILKNNATNMILNSNIMYPITAVDMSEVLIIPTAVTRYGIQFNSITGTTLFITAINLTIQDVGNDNLSNYQSALFFSGNGVNVFMKSFNLFCTSPFNVKGIEIYDGAVVRLTNGAIVNFKKNCTIYATGGLAPTVYALAVLSLPKRGTIPVPGQLLDVQHPTAFGSFNGIIDTAGTINHSSSFNINDMNQSFVNNTQSGGSASFFEFSQPTPSSSWTITHNLGYYPSITVTDSGGSIVEGDITHTSINQAIVSFSAPFAGTVHCS